MAIEFDIIKYICGLTDYTISESVATNIALRRGVSEVTEYKELTQKDNDLLLADILTSLAFRPKKTASTSQSHGGYSVSIGSEEMHDIDKLLEYAKKLYEKWEEPIPEMLNNIGNLEWLDM